MANAGTYLVVVRNDSEVPTLVHQVWPNTEEGQKAAYDHAWGLFQSAKGRIPFAVAELHLSPQVTAPSSDLQERVDRAMNFILTQKIAVGSNMVDGDVIWRILNGQVELKATHHARYTGEYRCADCGQKIKLNSDDMWEHV